MSATIDQVLRAAVEKGDVPCAVAMAADETGICHQGAAGPRAVGAEDPITPDSVLRIASMTKVVTTVAALQLVERGDLDLDAPVDTYCPRFAELGVLEGFDGDTARLRPPATRATVRQLANHTAGLGYWFLNADIARWEQLTGSGNILSGSSAVFTAPLVADPGTRFVYGIGHEWLGKVVEAVSGHTLDTYLRQAILDPLGMPDTGYVLTEKQRVNCVPIHVRGQDGAWLAAPLDYPAAPEFWAGGGTLYCTPREFLTFQRMLLGRGALGAVRIVGRELLEAAFTNQIGDLEFPSHLASADPMVTADLTLGPGLKFGLGLLHNPMPMPGGRAAGSGGWSGVFNTHFLGRPRERSHRGRVHPDLALRRAARPRTVRRVRTGALRLALMHRPAERSRVRHVVAIAGL